MELLKTKSPGSKSLTILQLNASARKTGSTSRRLTDETIEALTREFSNTRQLSRDLGEDMPHIDDAWVEANTTPPEQRTADQRATLEFSDTLIEEMKASDIIVVGVPVYNFTIPSTLKAWIDHVCRAGLTFSYSESGPEGLLSGKTAIIAFATGGTEIGSSIDYASQYMKHIFGFIGISDVHIVAADRLYADLDKALSTAREQISNATSALVANAVSE